MSPWGAAPQWCSVTVDVGQCFVCGLCVPLPYCFSHTGAISSYVYYVRMTFFSESWTGCCMVSSARLVLSGCSSSPGTSVIRQHQNTPSAEKFPFVRQAVGDGVGAAEGEERWAVGCVCVLGWGVFPCVFPSIQTLGACSAMM